jgi:uncharacterized protein (TIGR02646 family)
MRWICRDDIEAQLTQDWRDSATAALGRLQAAADADERKTILGRQSSSDVWRDFYALLPAGLKMKCWYCEVDGIRADMPIDHFRPKNKVDGVDDHDGYWWLAFNWANYRCACTFCNSRRVFDDTDGGKACKFPIVDEAVRAFSPTDDCGLEEVDFLDPFEPDDEKLLWFDNDGVPTPKPDSSASQELKVENSIDIFHLHEARIVRARNEIRLEVERQVRGLREGAPGDIVEAKNTLRRMVRPSERLSRAAIVYLRQHRELEAVRNILELD